MQTIPFYVNAESTLGEVRDYANAQNTAAPTLTRGVSACLKMRLFANRESCDPYPLTDLAAIPTWQWVMDDDFDSSSSYILVADHDRISVSRVEETINGTTFTYTEFTIPIPCMNTEELNTLLGTSESIATLNGELIGNNSDGSEVFVLQVKGFTVRNRISSTGNPTDIDSEYLTEAQVRALCSAGLDLIFSRTNSETASDWHKVQTSSDKYFRVRLKGDFRNWTSGNASDYGWSDCFGLLLGATGTPGADGKTWYCHAAFATAADGTGFITDATDWTANHKYIAFLTTEKQTVTAADFAGLWVKFIIDKAENIAVTDTGNYFQGSTVEAVLQEVGATLAGLEQLLAEI